MKTGIFQTPSMVEVITRKVKTPLTKSLALIDRFIPEPTKDNTQQRNTRILIDLMEFFFNHLNYYGDKYGEKERALRAVWKLFIVIYDYDPPYRDAFNLILKKLLERIDEWDFPGYTPDPRFWKD